MSFPIEAKAPGSAAEPVVSVIIPVFNGEATIGQTLLSARKQSLRNIEIIVVDDGSNDRTLSILDAHAALDPRVRVIAQKNSGVADARNTGLKAARGAYVATLDADDLWLPRKLERQVAAIEAAGADCGLAYCYFDAIDAEGRRLWRGKRLALSGKALEPLLEEDFIGNGSNALIRRDLIERTGGFDTSLRDVGAQGSEDWQMALRIAELTEFVCVPEVLLCYRRLRGNMSAHAVQMLRSASLVAEQYRERYPHLGEQLDRQLAGRKRWLLARSLSEANIGELRGLVGEFGSVLHFAGLAATVMVSVAREVASRAARSLGLRKSYRYRV